MIVRAMTCCRYNFQYKYWSYNISKKLNMGPSINYDVKKAIIYSNNATPSILLIFFIKINYVSFCMNPHPSFLLNELLFCTLIFFVKLTGTIIAPTGFWGFF